MNAIESATALHKLLCEIDGDHPAVVALRAAILRNSPVLAERCRNAVDNALASSVQLTDRQRSRIGALLLSVEGGGVAE